MKKLKNPRIVLWILGSLLLLSLNFGRDLRDRQKKFEWEPVTSSTLHRGVSTPGVMEAIRVAEIKSEVEETVEKKMVVEGERVKQGQPLVQLSRDHTLLEYEQKKNSLDNLKSDYRKSVRELAIQKKLLRSLAVSKQQVEDAEQAVEKNTAALQLSTQEFAIVQEKLDSTLVRSPMDGVVLKDYTKIGQALTTGKEVITVGDISKFIVRAKVDELDIEQIKIGQGVEITADAFPGKIMQGKVSSIASQAERETFAKVEVVIDITDSVGLSLKHNLSVRVNIVTEDLPSSLSVPVKSILKKKEGNAWIIMKNGLGLVTQRRIKIGKTAGDRIQVISGVKPGEFVGTEKAPDLSS